VGLLAIFVGYRLVALTQNGEMLWFVADGRAKLFENGEPVDGWLHREWKNRVLIVTRKDGQGRESYLVISGSRRDPFVEGCDGWTAPHLAVLPFPVFVSDALPCPGWRLPEHATLFGRPMLSSTSVQFVDERGQTLQVRWK
jgi:hypothetical protein